MKRRVVIAGAGVRGLCFAKGMLNQVQDYTDFVALYDTNAARMQGFNNLLKANVPMYTDWNKIPSSSQFRIASMLNLLKWLLPPA